MHLDSLATWRRCWAGLLQLWLLFTVGCLPSVALPPEASPPDYFEESVASVSVFTYEGYTIGPMRIKHYRRTALKDGREVTRIHITEGKRDWRVSCLLELEGQRRVRRTCSVTQDDVHGVLVLQGADTAPLSGQLYAWVPLELEGLSDDSVLVGSYTPGLLAHAEDGLLGTVIAMGPWTKLRISRRADDDERSWLRLLALLQASLSDPRDAALDQDGFGPDESGTAPAPLDSYELRPRNREADGSPDRDRLAALKELALELHRDGHAEAALQLHRLRALDRDKVFDEASGPLARRTAVRAPIMELAGGPVWLPTPDGAPASGRFHFAGGLRIYERTTVTIGMGMQFPAFSLDSLDEQLVRPAGSYSSGAFNIELTGRHAFGPSLEGLEPVVGLSLRSRFAFLGYQHPSFPLPEEFDSHVGSLHVGLGMATIAGVQWAYELNAIGSRFVIFTEFQPEVMFWPVRNATDQSDGTVPQAPAVIELFRDFGSEPTLQLGVSSGIRLEL